MAKKKAEPAPPAEKPTIHLRQHEFAGSKPRIRVWNDEMERYGQFEIVAYDEITAFKALSDKMCLLSFVQHFCDTKEDCDCRPLHRFEPIEV